VRHGETPWNAEGRWQGLRDIDLSAEGRVQALALHERFAGHSFSVVASSSLSRARETAELASGQSPVLIPALREISYGEWEGVRDVEIKDRWPELRRLWMDAPGEVTMPGGETLEAVEARAWPAFLSILDGSEGDALIVAHGGVNRLLLGKLLGLPLASFWRLAQDPSAVNIVELPAGPAVDALAKSRVRLINCTAHLL
jgi:probable phosphoglycerate mutase